MAGFNKIEWVFSFPKKELHFPKEGQSHTKISYILFAVVFKLGYLVGMVYFLSCFKHLRLTFLKTSNLV